MASEVKSDPGGVRSQVRGSESPHSFFCDCEREMLRAQKLFPSSEGVLTALMEEVGELAQAMLDKSWDEVVKEAKQVAAMAGRIALEGDPLLSVVRARRAAIREASCGKSSMSTAERIRTMPEGKSPRKRLELALAEIRGALLSTQTFADSGSCKAEGQLEIAAEAVKGALSVTRGLPDWEVSE